MSAEIFNKAWGKATSTNYERVNKELISSFLLLLGSFIISIFLNVSNIHFNKLEQLIPRFLVDKSIVFQVLRASTYLLIIICIIYKAFEQINKHRIKSKIKNNIIPTDIHKVVWRIRSDYTIPRIVLARTYFSVVMIYVSIILLLDPNFVIMLLNTAYKDSRFGICFVLLFLTESFPALKQFFWRSINSK